MAIRLGAAGSGGGVRPESLKRGVELAAELKRVEPLIEGLELRALVGASTPEAQRRW